MFFEPVEAQETLVAAGVVQSLKEQKRAWQAQMAPLLEVAGLKMPAPPDAKASPNGRNGQHTDDLRVLLDEMGSVRRTEPGAKW